MDDEARRRRNRPAPTPRGGRRRGAALAWIAAAVSLIAVALTARTTLAGFTASIDNTTNTAGTGTLVMEEDQAATTCLSSSGAITVSNAGTCATIDKFGGNLGMVPGQSVSTTIAIKNIGSTAANTFTLTPGSCTQSNNGALNGSAVDFCAKLDVLLKSGATTIFTGTAASLAAGGAIALSAPVAAGANVPFTFTVTVDASVDNSYQGLALSEPLTWAFAS